MSKVKNKKIKMILLIKNCTGFKIPPFMVQFLIPKTLLQRVFVIFIIGLFNAAIVCSTHEPDKKAETIEDETFISESKALTRIEANSTEVFFFRNSEELAIYEIDLKLSREAKTARIDIEKTMIAEGIELPVHMNNGSIYKILYVAKKNINDSQIISADIKFKIPNYWLNFHNINPELVEVKELKNRTWKAVETKKIGKDEEYHYYIASVSNFTIFAITGNKNNVKNLTQSKAENNETATIIQQQNNINKSIAEENITGKKQPIKPLLADYLGITGATAINHENKEKPGLLITAIIALAAITLIVHLYVIGRKIRFGPFRARWYKRKLRRLFK